MPSPTFALLIDHPQFIPLVANWYFVAFGSTTPGNSIEITEQRIRSKLNREGPPLHVVATVDGQLAAVAQWKRFEMPEFSDKEHWLGSLYVASDRRGQGLAGKLALEVADIASAHGVRELFLSTEYLDGGLYKRAGWQPYKQIISRGDPVLVMVKQM